MLVQLLISGAIAIALPFLFTVLLLKISDGSLHHDQRPNFLTKNRKQIFFINLTMTVIQFSVVICSPNIQWTHNKSIYETAVEVWLMLFLADLFNYFFHRLCHENRFLYKAIHYLHHEYVIPNEIWSFWYVHPVEMFISNIVFAAPLLLWNTTFLAVCLYGSISILFTTVNHMALVIPPPFSWVIESHFHYLHHTDRRCNYAEHFTLIDRFFGTCKL